MTGTPAPGQYFNPSSIKLSNFSFTGSGGNALRLYIDPFGCIPLTTNFSANQNYVLTTIPQVSGLTDSSMLKNKSTCQLMQTVQYIDGLGRPVQTVQVRGSHGGNDVVQPIAYDPFGREATKYQPYTITAGSSDGSFKTNALTAQAAFYNPATPGAPGIATTLYPYAQTGFEASPHNRPVEQGAPGTTWQLGSGHTVGMAYATNGSSEVVNWTVKSNGNGATGSTNYAAGTLFVNTTKDENGHNTITYTDMQNRTVCKKVQNGASTYIGTNYVYDDHGNLAYVIPPIPTGTTYPTTFTETDAVFGNFIYGYHYDTRNRLLKKKVPGKGWEYTVYNKLDQVVATQDSVQKGIKQWSFMKYDALGRVVITGTWDNGGTAISPAALQSSINSLSVLWEANTTIGTGYTNNSWPTANNTNLTINYYDSYANAIGLPVAYSAPAGATTSTRGLLVATKIAVLNTPADLLWTVNYYDDRARVIQTYNQHYMGGTVNVSNYDQLSSTYNFSDQVISSLRKHYTNAAGLALTLKDSLVYDHADRLTQTWNKINSNAAVLLNQTDYNEIGQQQREHLHSQNNGKTYLQNINYAYNERGWLTTSSAPLFAMQLKYNDGTVPQYNGNIADMNYTGANSGAKTFNYTYDYLNRLSSAVSTGGSLNESLTYDYLGNITALTRGGQSYSTLAYTYTGNQLNTVTGTGFTARSYGYDANGNATGDGVNKSIAYNMLNLPQSITQSGSTIASYSYNAAGAKLRNTSTADGNWDYISGIVYHNDTLAFIQTGEGRITTKAGYDYQYDLKDHLGNVRLSFNKGPDNTALVMQEDEYYAFGLKKQVYNNLNNNRYLYNGKELQADLANQYDYGARFYDPVIGRWNTVDPLAEESRKWSPYTYGKNNPIIMIDPDGMFDVNINGDERDKAFAELQKSVQGQLDLSMDDNGKVTYKEAVPGQLIGSDSKQLMKAINDHSVTVNVEAIKGNSYGDANIVGGGFFGNTLNSNGHVNTLQVVNASVLNTIDTYYNNPGATMLHEVTESYEGGKIAQSNGKSSTPATASDIINPNSDYRRSHKAATNQGGEITALHFGVMGTTLSQPASMGRTDYTINSPGKPSITIQSTYYPKMVFRRTL